MAGFNLSSMGRPKGVPLGTNSHNKCSPDLQVGMSEGYCQK